MYMLQNVAYLHSVVSQQMRKTKHRSLDYILSKETCEFLKQAQ